MDYKVVMSPEGVRFVEEDAHLLECVMKISSDMPDDTAELLLSVLDDAAKNAEDAARCGYNHDYGAKDTVLQVVTYIHGYFHTVPAKWQRIYQSILNRRDPEYQKYLELYKKFGGAASE